MSTRHHAYLLQRPEVFFTRVLRREWGTFEYLRAQREKKLPSVLSWEEVQRVLAQVAHRTNHNHAFLATTVYACGLAIDTCEDEQWNQKVYEDCTSIAPLNRELREASGTAGETIRVAMSCWGRTSFCVFCLVCCIDLG